MFIRSVDHRWLARFVATLAACTISNLAPAQSYPNGFGFGNPATEKDIAAEAIGIAPDGKGLPVGKGDYYTGRKVYQQHCAACHGEDLQGVSGLLNMGPLIGGRGTLATPNPVLTVESYWPYATTLFDYIRRAMPFTAPGSLAADEVYAVSAYILVKGGIIKKSIVLDQHTLPKVKMPNRNGFVPDPRPETFQREHTGNPDGY